MSILEVSLTYSGQDADRNILEMYDLAQAVLGLQRTLALTTHLILNNKVITQAPALKNADIYIEPFEAGSFKSKAIIMVAGASALYHLGTAPKDTPLGHLIYSGYSYVISEALGIDEVNYDETLQQQLKQHNEEQGFNLDQSRFDSVVEKCENSVLNMHRPIYKSKSASSGKLECKLGGRRIPVKGVLNYSTYEYLSESVQSEIPQKIKVKVTSYNINSYKGRLFSPEFGNRTIPFTLEGDAKFASKVSLITSSLSIGARNRDAADSFVEMTCLKISSSTGRLKAFIVFDVTSPEK